MGKGRPKVPPEQRLPRLEARGYARPREDGWWVVCVDLRVTGFRDAKDADNAAESFAQSAVRWMKDGFSQGGVKFKEVKLRRQRRPRVG